MKVLLLNGSANKNGNTFTALSEIARQLEKNGVESEIMQLGNKPVRGCIACGQCQAKQLGHCVFDATIKRVTGHSVTSYIDRHTIPILKDYLNDERLSLTQIADLMNFTSLSYFSRYCTKHLGQSPSDYRLSLQPK